MESDDFRYICHQEFDQLIWAITNIESESQDKFYGYCTIYFTEIAEALVKLVDPNQGEESAVDMQILGLKILRKIIESENQNEEVRAEHKPCYDWETEDWKLYK